MSGIAIDRARIQQRVWDGARAAGRVAWAVAKSAGHFLAACGVIVVFGVVAFGALLNVRKPDSELLRRAIVQAHDAVSAATAVHPSALAERDTALIGLALAVVVMAGGIWWLAEWWRSLPFGRKAWVLETTDTDTK